MAKVILLCGKLASGKTTYANALKARMPAVLLSCDELMLTLFPQGAGLYHDELSVRARNYLLALAEALCQNDVNVILDWGFWTRQSRRSVREYFDARGITCELHYIDAKENVWQEHIQARNAAVQAGSTTAYFIDEGLLAKMNVLFEMPVPEEIDVRYEPN